MDDRPHAASLCNEQRRCWEAGDPVPVEAFLRRLPELEANPEAVLDLIYNEVYLRTEKGDRPELTEYRRRFPHLDSDLRLLFEVHEALEEHSNDRATALLHGRRPPALCPAPLPAATLVPGYEILGELGRGGMGVVYKARDLELKRLVALKMILAGPHASDMEMARFRAEAEALARLQHPNIVQIYTGEVHDGRPCFSLELVEGESLKKRLDSGPLSPPQAAEVAEALARALQHAHAQDIVHRDIKPGNVLLGLQESSPGAKPTELAVKLTDFGLAKFLDVEHGSTTTGAFLGTPNYTSPEQAEGRSELIGPATDIYGLGAVLYEMLTGRPPFQGRSPYETLVQVRSHDPDPPSRVQKGVPRDLEAICLKCLAKLPAERYATAAELAEDLRRFRDGEPVCVRPVAGWQRWLRRARRRPAFRAVLWTLGVALLSLAAVEVWHLSREDRVKTEARQAEIDRRRRARDDHDLFLRRRNDALFHGIYGTLFADSDSAHNLEATRSAAQEALALVQVRADRDKAPALDPYWTQAEQREVTSGCYQLLLLLAETEAHTKGMGPSQRPERLQAALAVLDRAAKLFGATPAYHLRRARYLQHLGDPLAAAGERERAARMTPTRMIDHFLLGEESYQQGNFAEAQAHFERALGELPHDFWSRYYLAICLLKLNRSAESRNALTVCLEQEPRFVWSYLLRAFAHEQLGAIAEAEEDYRHALKLEPNSDATYFLHVNRGRMYLRKERFAEASADLQEAVACQPQRHEAYVNLARVARREGKADEASRSLEQARQRRLPDAVLAEYHIETAQQCFAEKRFQECVEKCGTALQLQPDGAEVHGLRGRALLQLQRYRAAAEDFDRYLALGGKSPADIYRGRGLARMKQRDYPGAVDDYTRALELADRPDVDIHLHRGWAYFFADSWKLAQRDFEAALRLDAKSPDALTGRGLCRVIHGQYREAVADADASLKHAPASAEMMHNNACIFAQALARLEGDDAATDRAELCVQYRNRAVEVLTQAVKMLPRMERAAFWRNTVRADKALDPIRKSQTYQQLDEEITSRSDK